MSSILALTGWFMGRRRALRLVCGATAAVLLDSAVSAGARASDRSAAQTSELTANLRISESTTAHNSYPDDCDMRLDQLYIAEDLALSIAVQFNRDLSDDEARQVQWSVSNGNDVWSMGDFVGQANPAQVTTVLAPGRGGDRTQATVRITYQGSDIAQPAPLRLVTNDEYDAAIASLTRFTAAGGRRRGRLPLSVDLLSRFLGQDSTAVGTPSVGTYPLSICDPRLTHRAGANWGGDTVTDVPLVQYSAGQRASQIVAAGVARALLAQNVEDIRQFFAGNPQASTYAIDVPYDGNLTLNRPLDAALALHGVQFAGALSGSVDAPVGPDAPLTARNVQVQGTVSDLYDFDLGATGGGALPAAEAAKVEIASVKHDIGKVFVVSFDLDSTFSSLDV